MCPLSTWVLSIEVQGVVSNVTTRMGQQKELMRSYLLGSASMCVVMVVDVRTKFQHKGGGLLIRIVVARSMQSQMVGMDE